MRNRNSSALITTYLWDVFDNPMIAVEEEFSCWEIWSCCIRLRSSFCCSIWISCFICTFFCSSNSFSYCACCSFCILFCSANCCSIFDWRADSDFLLVQIMTIASIRSVMATAEIPITVDFFILIYCCPLNDFSGQLFSLCHYPPDSPKRLRMKNVANLRCFWQLMSLFCKNSFSVSQCS